MPAVAIASSAGRQFARARDFAYIFKYLYQCRFISGVMTATRRSQNASPEKANVKKTEVTEKQARKRKPVEDTVQEPVAETSNTRPKRNARKSVLLSSADFEVHLIH